MSNKASFESRIMDFFTNAPYERVDLTFGLVKEIFKRRKADHAEESTRVGQIAQHPAPPRVKRKRRTKAQIAADEAAKNARGELRDATKAAEEKAFPAPF